MTNFSDGLIRNNSSQWNIFCGFEYDERKTDWCTKKTSKYWGKSWFPSGIERKGTGETGGSYKGEDISLIILFVVRWLQSCY